MTKFSVRNRRNLILFSLLLSGCLFFVISYAFSPLFSENSKFKSKTGSAANSTSPSLVINEVCAQNSGFYEENLRILADYIEIYNAGDTSVSLNDFYLSDNTDIPLQSQLPDDIILEPGTCFLIYAGKDSAKLPPGSSHVDFQLKAGEALILSSKTGILDSVNIPELQPGTSYSRTEDGSGSFAEMWMSPGVSNQTATFPLNPPVFSQESGFYPNAFSLTLSSDENTQIYYTLDGSLPDKNSLPYEEPLVLSDISSQENVLSSRTDISSMGNPYTPPVKSVDKAVILRAVAVDEAGNYSPAATHVYFIGFQEKEGYENIPVLSLITEPESLFDSDRGIYIMGSHFENGLSEGEISPDSIWSELIAYTNYGQRGSFYERPVHFDYFSGDQKLLFSQEGGFRIRGNQSRDFPQKSFSLYSRRRYGEEFFPPVFFDSSASCSALTLNGSYNLSKVLIGELVSDRNVAVQKYQPCQVFLNGEYWGLYYLMEKYDDTYINHYYDIDTKDVLMIESTYEVAEGNPEDLQLFKNLRNLLEMDMSEPLNYTQAEYQMDMQSFIDWLCINIYVVNTDTKPLGGNVFTWKSTQTGDGVYQDGRWRWMLYDTDDSFGAGMDISEERPAWAIDSFTDHPGYSPAGFLDSPPMTALMANETFRQRFVTTFSDMANENFRGETVSAKIDAILEAQTLGQAKNTERWTDAHTYDDSAFLEKAEFIRDFFLHRFDAVMPCLASHFSLNGDLVPVTLSLSDAQAGVLTLNTITPNLKDSDWTGQYYTDYPITLTASPSEGYSFTNWEITGGNLVTGTITSSSVTVQLEGGAAHIKACFEKTAP